MLGIEYADFFNDFSVGGHRGSPKKAPENSIPSFEVAKSEGCDLVHFDLQLSSDKIPILMHDSKSGRTAVIDVQVDATPAHTLMGTDLIQVGNYTAKIPSLKQAVEWCTKNDMKMLINVMDANSYMLDEIVRLFRNGDVYSSLIITSHNPIVPYLLKRMDNRILTGYNHRRGYFSYEDEDYTKPKGEWYSQWALELVDEINFIMLRSLILPRFLGVDMLLLNHREINVEFKEEARIYGIKMVSWTVNDKNEARWLSDVVKIPEHHIVIGVTSEDISGYPYCGGNRKHDIRNLMPNATQNTKIIKIQDTVVSRPNNNKCMTIYVIRVPPTQPVNNPRTAPDYVKYVGEKYGDAVKQRADLDKNPSRVTLDDYQYQPNDKYLFQEVLRQAVNKNPWNQRNCYFDLARFRFEPSRYNNLIVWPDARLNPYGLLTEKFYVKYMYKNMEYYIDTFSIC